MSATTLRASTSSVTCQVPGGAFYVWPNVTEACRRIGAADSEEFRKRLLHEAGVAVLADIHFGMRVPGEGQHLRFSYAASKQAIEAGHVPGPRMFVVTRAISTTGGYALEGYAPEVVVPKGVQIVDGPIEARKAARERLDHGADWIKVYMTHRSWVDGKDRLVSQPTLTLEEIKAIVQDSWDFADASPEPPLEALYEDVFVDTTS